MPRPRIVDNALGVAADPEASIACEPSVARSVDAAKRHLDNGLETVDDNAEYKTVILARNRRLVDASHSISGRAEDPIVILTQIEALRPHDGILAIERTGSASGSGQP